MPEIRRADIDDLPSILALEQAAFQPYRQSSPGSLRRSLTSAHQSVWVIEREGRVVADLILWHRAKSIRIYGVAVDPGMQGLGLGRKLMAHAIDLARAKHQSVLLEADVTDHKLVAWYEQQGFVKRLRKEDFYAEGKHAWRMVLTP